MNYYLEITLIDGEKSLYELWAALYLQVHFSLVAMQKMNTHNIGVSFPNYRFIQKDGRTFASLGDKLRIFADDEELLGVFMADLQNRLNDYVKNWEDFLHFKSIKAVPENHGHAIFKRYHAKNMEKVAQEFAEFKGIDFDTALTHCQTHKAQPKHHPFIRLKSETTGQDFCLMIEKQTVEQAVIGKFSSYGLGGASVPDFS